MSRKIATAPPPVAQNGHAPPELPPMPRSGRFGKSEGISIPEPRIQTIEVPIVGISPLIVLPWSEKATRQMEDAQSKKAKAPKEPRDPQAEFDQCRYVSDEGWDGVPATAFKSAIVGASRAVDGLPMTIARRMVYVLPDGFGGDQPLVRLRGKLHRELNKAHVRNANGGADIRYRSMYREWSVLLRVEFNAQILNLQQIMHLIDNAGLWEGICEWRPSCKENNSGQFGRFRVERKEKS